ncbi:hypothetical protein B0T14DRAFT_517380 [Immersiella caudata]|uniref:Uncharacterized protein n=1 Tax=Immersiella caudata TaxID=314043 RepID=A0AA39WYI7_9PEZI|nr:hypothetical protein B0T14DRAFT_517380 [Immersiella caudata]
MESFEEKLQRVAELDVPAASPRTESDKQHHGRESPRRSSATRGRSNHHRPPTDDDRRHGSRPPTTHRPDASAPRASSTTRSQRYGPSASLEDEPKRKSREVLSSVAQREQPDPPTRARTMDTINGQPRSSDRPSSPSSLYVAARTSTATSTGQSNKIRDQSAFAPMDNLKGTSSLATTAIGGGNAAAAVELDATPIRGHRPPSCPASTLADPTASSYPVDPGVSRMPGERDLESVSRAWEVIVNEQAQTIAKLQREKLSIVGDVKDLQQKNDDLVVQVEDLRDMLASKVIPATHFGASLIPDTHVQGRWNELCFDIRQCVTEHVKPPGGAWYARNMAFTDLAKLTPDYIVFLSDINGCCRLAEAIIWDIISRNVFGNGDKMGKVIWAGKPSGNLRCLLDGAFQLSEQDQEKAFHTWRRQTATFFSTHARPKDVQTQVDSLVREVESKLKHILINRGKAGLKEQLKKIFFDAIRLDCDLLQQSAFWFVRYPDTDQTKRYGVKYSEDTMKLVSADHDSPLMVDLMISPALFKAGDSHGEDYGRVELACKSMVSACEVRRWRTLVPAMLGGLPEGADPLTGMTRLKRRTSTTGGQGGKWRSSQSQL